MKILYIVLITLILCMVAAINTECQTTSNVIVQTTSSSDFSGLTTSKPIIINSGDRMLYFYDTTSASFLPANQLVLQNSQSAAYTTTITDIGKQILHPNADNNARTFTIAANASVAYPVGTCITFINEINTVTIAINSDTLVLAGAGTTGSRTLAANGIATAIKITSTKWIISGTGLT